MKSGSLPGRILTLFISLVLLILLASPPVAALDEGGTQHPLGLKWSDDIESLMAAHQPKLARESFSAAAVPASADWTLNMPPVGDQGSQGSCVAWSMGYALRTYLYQVKTSWGVKTADHQFSPAYIYNQINGGADQGLSPYDAAQLLESQGCATLAVMPYNDSDYKTQPNAAQRANAANYQIADWEYLDNNTTAIKSALASGPVWSGLTVYWTSGWQSSGEISLSQVSSGMSAAGGHGICLVGYDDNRATADGSGAFKFINSWGKGWGQSGYGWISYQYLQKYGKGAVVLYESASPTGLNISSPAAGAAYTAGQTVPIKWTASGIDKVDIYLISLKPGVKVAAGVTASSGSYSWTIPGNLEPGAYKIQINGVGTGSTAVSEWFNISAASSAAVNVTGPPAGANIAVGQNLPISWSATGLEKVDIYLIGLKPGVSVAAGVPASAGAYSWTIPAGIEPGSYKIQINGSGTGTYGLSDWFTIQAVSGPAIGVTAPLGSTRIAAGQNLPISWTATGLEKVDIYLISLKPGLAVAAGLSASAGAYNWSIPAGTEPGLYKIQINGSGTGVYAVSDWFAIEAPSGPAITISNPAAGAGFPIGGDLPINWTATGLDKVDIYLISLQPGIAIAVGIPANAGSYSWKIPSGIVPGSYQVQINGQGTGIYATTGWFNIQT